MKTLSASNGSQTAANTAYGLADQLLTQRGRTFHWARRLLSTRHAERATRLYGFCRHIDDLVDDSASLANARAALVAVRQALQTGQSDDPVTCDMLQLMRACDINPTIPLELIDGVESDLGAVRVTDMAELLRYCYRVAGTVGLMMTDALDVSAPEALPHAVDLGIAIQLTNICRDLREDAFLHQLSQMPQKIQCGCPNHLADLLLKLIAFERYSLECESTNAKDAAMHALMHSASGRCRELLEDVLRRLMAHEGIAEPQR